MSESSLVDLEGKGYALVPGVLSLASVRIVADALEAVMQQEAGEAGSRRDGQVYALRNVLPLPEVQNVIHSEALRSVVEGVLGSEAFPVRGILFDKTAGANWNVAWHQDIAVPVKARRDGLPGWSGWSVKAGVIHVHPPAMVLERMLTVRIHLDACSLDNGPLRVLPGTHRFGRLSNERIAGLREEGTEVVCTAAAGDALLMRPLLLHASSGAQQPGHRRVLHLEWASSPLPQGMEWAETSGMLP